GPVAWLRAGRRRRRVLYARRTARYRRELSRHDECLLRRSRFSLSAALDPAPLGSTRRYRRAQRIGERRPAVAAGRGVPIARPFLRALYQSRAGGAGDRAGGGGGNRLRLHLAEGGSGCAAIISCRLAPS